MPSPGQLIPVAIQLGLKETDRHVRATIKDPADNQITGSPFTLSHKGQGAYAINTVAMPDKAFIRVTYEVFKDAGFNTEDINYPAVGGCFIRDDLLDAVDNLNASIQSDLVAVVEDTGDLKAVVDDDIALIGVVEPTGDLEAVVSDVDALTGTVEDENTIQGEIE